MRPFTRGESRASNAAVHWLVRKARAWQHPPAVAYREASPCLAHPNAMAGTYSSSTRARMSIACMAVAISRQSELQSGVVR
jgi:hypothetical protein